MPVADLPNFLIVGAAKAGTSSLYHYLAPHPDVFMSPTKETNFFALGGRPAAFRGPGDDEFINRHSVHDEGRYRDLFAAGGAARRVGEASPLYLYDEHAPRRIAATLPDVKLVAVLRDPVDRCYASYLHMRREGREPIDDFEEALAAEPDRVAAGWEFIWHYQRVSRYAEQVERYRACFEADQFRFFLYDDLVAEPMRFWHDLCAFLGLDPDPVPDLAERHNRTGVPRSLSVQRLVVRDNRVRDAARRLLPAPARRQVRRRLERWNVRRPPLAPQVRRQLIPGFHDDIEAVESLVGRALPGWRA